MRQPIQFSPSRRLAYILISAHSVAIAIALLLLPLLAGLALALVLLLSLFASLRRYAWLGAPHACTGLVLDEEGTEFIRRDGTRLPCRILPGSLVSPWLTVLNVRPEGARFARNVVILPDSLDAELFRQLRVWLRWGDHSAGAGSEGMKH